METVQPWLGETLPPHRHLVRLSYDAPPPDPERTIVADLRAITGAEIPVLVDVALRSWTRTLDSGPVPAGVFAVGEAGSASGLSRVIAGARAVAARLIGRDLIGSSGPGNEG